MKLRRATIVQPLSDRLRLTLGAVALALVVVTLMVAPSCATSTQPAADLSIGPLWSAPEIDCATAVGSAAACCVEAERVNAYLSALPPPSIADGNAAFRAFAAYRAATCGGACMRTASGCL